MRTVFGKLLFTLPFAALASGCGTVSAATGDARAISLNVIESSDTVEIQVVADSQVTQQIEFTAELSGGSNNSRHKSSSSIAAGDRQVLSRLKTGRSDDWCAKVEVSEASGQRYTLTAGDCGLI